MVTEAGIRREIESFVRKVAKEEAEKAAKKYAKQLADSLVACGVAPPNITRGFDAK
jgi:predicted metal-dependent hydrolase